LKDNVYIKASTVRRLIKAVRSDDPPIRVKGAAEQQAALTALQTELLALRLSVQKFRWEYEKRSGLTFSFDSNYVYVFFQDDLLVLSANAHAMPFQCKISPSTSQISSRLLAQIIGCSNFTESGLFVYLFSLFLISELKSDSTRK
jgi:hypothetical protein